MHASLNLAYRLVWSELRNTWVAVAETAKARGKGGRRAMASLLLAAGLGCAGGALADSWVGSVDDWTQGGNWQDGSVPTINDVAEINNGGTSFLTNNTTANVGGIQLGMTTRSYLLIGNANLLNSGGTVIGNGIVDVYNGGVLQNQTDLEVGYLGVGRLNIITGGNVTNTVGRIGNQSGSQGTVVVDGTGSSWANNSDLYVGVYGSGILNITSGGAVSNTIGYIGQNSGSTGTVTVDGTGSKWTNTDSLLVGYDGSGTLNISNGGAVSNTAGYIGTNLGSTGTVTLDGTGSTWTNSSLQVGNYGNGTLNITNGGSVSSSVGYIGRFSDSTGTATVSGANSTWTNRSNLFVGFSGTATLNISNGGAVSNNIGYIGRNSGSTGTATVSGANSTWTNNSDLYVGVYGSGMLNISNGGAVSNTIGYIGRYSVSTGTVTVDGTGSSWTSTSDLLVGVLGTGVLNISNSGTVSVNTGRSVIISDESGSTGTLNIGAAQGSAAVAAGTLNTETVNFGAGTGKLVFNHTNTDYVFAPSFITGAGDIGLYAGTTRFAGSLSSYTGTMTVDGGTLNIADGSTLFLGGHYTQTADGTLKIGASSASSFGKLDVTGQATFAAGTGLDVNVAGTNTLANGNTLTNVVSAGNLTASTFNVTDNSTLFNFTASVTAGANGHVDLLTTSASTSGVYDSVANEGFNQGKNAARVLDTLVNGGTTNTDMDNVVTAFGQLNGGNAISNAVAQTLPLMSAGLASVAMNTMHSNSRVIQARQESNHGLSSGDAFLGNKKIWLKPLGAKVDQDDRDGVSGYQANTFGFIAGIDGEIDESNRIGVALSYMNSNVDGKSAASGNRADVDAYQAIVYGSHSLSNLSDTEVSWQADLGLNKNNGHRNINFGGLNRVAKANYDSITAHMGAGIARNYKLDDKTTITPAVRADYTYIRDESYTETGAGALNLKVNSHSTDELIVLAEGRLSHKLSDKATLIANAGVGYDILNGKNSITASYTGGGAAFSTEGMDVSPWLGRAGLGLAVNVTETIDIAARYDMEARSDFLNQTASAKIRWAF